MKEDTAMAFDYSLMRGFNYQPSYASSSYEAWRWFDEDVFRRELGFGKKHFPRINTVRLWLSHDAYLRDREGFLDHFEKALGICDELNLRVIACLFNRWHNHFCDNGGIFMEKLFPATEMYDPDFYKPFLRDVCLPHREDTRILIWDLCNEPFSFDCDYTEVPYLMDALNGWLKSMSAYLSELCVTQDVGVSLHGSLNPLLMEMVEPYSTVLMVHPYLQRIPNEKAYRRFCQQVIGHLDTQKAFANAVHKPLIVTECCWGSIDDEVFAENIRATLTEYVKRGIGFVAHALMESDVADLHAPTGPIKQDMGQFNFLDKEGNIRPGLQVFNDFC